MRPRPPSHSARASLRYLGAALGVFLVNARAVAGDAPLLITLGEDYSCPAADPVGPGPDNTWTMTDARKRRVDCMLAGAQTELNSWRPSKDKVSSSTSTFTKTHAYVGLAASFATWYLKSILDRLNRNCRGFADPFGRC